MIQLKTPSLSLKTGSALLLSGFCLRFFCYLTVPGTAFQAADDLQSACDYALMKGLTFPCGSLCRPLPKGALGMYPTKALHDDGNLCIILLMWQSAVGHDFLSLVFVGKQMKVEIGTSHQHFCWFMGWIPHKTQLLGDVPMFWTVACGFRE
jgi:hypothetical protein